MVSIEDISKANKLSKELKKHGFAYDSGDAYAQAEKIFDKDKVAPVVERMAEEGSIVIEEHSEADLEELQQRINHLERFKEFALRKENKHREIVSELTEKMGELTKALNLVEMNQQAFERKLTQVKEPSCSCHVPESQPSQEEPNAVVEEIPTEPNSEPISEKPRNDQPVDASGIAPSEVAVEKIFYSGSN